MHVQCCHNATQELPTPLLPVMLSMLSVVQLLQALSTLPDRYAQVLCCITAHALRHNDTHVLQRERQICHRVQCRQAQHLWHNWLQAKQLVKECVCQEVLTRRLKGSFEFILEVCIGLEVLHSGPHLLQLVR